MSVLGLSFQLIISYKVVVKHRKNLENSVLQKHSLVSHLCRLKHGYCVKNDKHLVLLEFLILPRPIGAAITVFTNKSFKAVQIMTDELK